MTTYKSKCSECDRVFKKNSMGALFTSQAQADQAVRMHVGRVHTKNVKTYVRTVALVPASGAPPESVDRRSREWRAANGRGRGSLVATQEQKPRRRKEEHGDVCFCPRCGLNIGIAKTALIVALRHS